MCWYGTARTENWVGRDLTVSWISAAFQCSFRPSPMQNGHTDSHQSSWALNTGQQSHLADGWALSRAARRENKHCKTMAQLEPAEGGGPKEYHWLFTCG
jgi:hypothetical protein